MKDDLDRQIKAVLEKDIDEDILTLEASWTKEDEAYYAPSKKTEKTIISAIRGKRPTRTLRRIAAVLVLSVLSLGTLLTLKEDVAAEVMSYIEEWFGDHTAIHFLQKSGVEKKEWEITYVPEGYRYKKTEILDKGYHIKFYENQEKESITFEFVSKEGALTIGQDNENGEIKKITVGKVQAIIYVAHNNGFSNSIILENRDYTFIIDGHVAVEELVKMAKSIREKK